MIKDVMVHLDGGAEDEVRLAHAEAIVAASGGHLTGLFTNPLPDYAVAVPIDAGATAAQVVADLEQQAREEGDAMAARLTQRFARLGVANDLRRLDATPGGLAAIAAQQARCADLFVATRPHAAGGDTLWGDLVEAVLFGSGRAILLVPPGKGPSDAIRRVLVAWRDSRESARAAAEALPFIRNAGRTTVVMVDAEAAGSEAGAPEADIARHLSRHGAAVECRMVASDGRSVGEVLMEEARRFAADLVVMGGYGHSRLREWILGGTTYEMLSACDLPILIAH